MFRAAGLESISETKESVAGCYILDSMTQLNRILDWSAFRILQEHQITDRMDLVTINAKMTEQIKDEKEKIGSVQGAKWFGAGWNRGKYEIPPCVHY